MFAGVFALMGSWPGILALLAMAAVVWLFMRAATDLVTWVREEILDDPSRRSRAARHRRKP